MEFNINDFRRYLEAMTPFASVGLANNGCLCPIALWMSRELEIVDPTADMYNLGGYVHGYFEMYDTPVWAKDFIALIDDEEFDQPEIPVTREEALNVLDVIQGG